MDEVFRRPVEIFAPAKINLYLHVTGKRADGYHLLDSLVAFTDIGDRVFLSPATDFRFDVTGPCAPALAGTPNIAAEAAMGLARLCGRAADVHIVLDKNLPVASGIGGGSANAAAVLRGLLRLWSLTPDQMPGLQGLALSLGADVPVCLASKPARMTGIGEGLEAVSALPDLPVVLVNPGKACPTPDVFAACLPSFDPPAGPLPQTMDFDGLLTFLDATGNSLTYAAQSVVPEIAAVMTALGRTPGCALTRMSGSGATCFGLYRMDTEASEAAAQLKQANPEWWVKTGRLLS